jgi:hypothetical protein
MANTNRDVINQSMGLSQDPNFDDIQSAMGGTQPGGPIVITPVSISGTPPANGQVGQAYSFMPTTSNGSGARTYSLASGTLLSGLMLSTATGAITGTPTVDGVINNLSVRVTDATGNASTTPTTVTIAAAAGTAPMAMTLSNNRMTTAAPADREVGVLSGVENGATLSLVNDAGGAVALDSVTRQLRVVAAPTATGTPSVTVRKTLTGGATMDQTFPLSVGIPIIGSDTFDAGSGVEINGRALSGPGGKVWAGNASRWSVDSNGRAQHTQVASSDRMLFDAGTADHFVEAICRSHVTGGSSYNLAEIQFRGSDTGTWAFRAEARYNRVVLSYTSNITAASTTGGTLAKEYAFYQALNGQGASPSAVRLGARVKGDTISLYVNRVHIGDVVNTLGAGNTKVGFAALAGAGATASICTVDDFFCEPSTGVHINWPVWTPTNTTAPKIARGGNSDWDYTDVNNPQPFRDPVNNRWLMGYSGYANGDPTNMAPGLFAGNRIQHLGLSSATSLAGPWTKFSTTTPTITADPTLDGIYAFNGGSQYSEALGKFINVGVTSAGGELGLWTSTTAAVGSWVREGVIRNKSGWCSGGAFDSALIKLPDGTFELWYAGEQGTGSGLTGNRAYGRMTSPTGAFGTWTDDPANPLLYPRIDATTGAAWEQHLGEPQMYRVPEQPGQIICHFDGVLKKTNSGAAATADRHVHAAASFDNGKSWRYRLDALEPAGSGYMSVQVFDSHMMRDSETGASRLFYAAAPREGAALNIFIEIGDATGPLVTTLAA